MRGEHVIGAKADIKGLVQHTHIHKYDGQDGGGASGAGTSIFDPVLCELMYRWFCPPQGLVLDPFAGGSVRGIVSSKLGRPYVGVDLRSEQVGANRKQAKAICGKPVPKWIVGDSMDIAVLAKGTLADFVFSCPPYFDLERYSDDERDISTMDHDKFVACYGAIILKACAMLKQDRFACFVVGDIREKKGGGVYRNFPGTTIEAFRAAGLDLYNEIILVTAAGSLPLRVRKQFESMRKVGKTHQNALLFVKGDPRKATAAIGAVEFSDPVGLMPADAEAVPAGGFGEKL